MKREKILGDAIENWYNCSIKMLNWQGRNEYYELKRRLDSCVLTYFYLSLREKIKKEVQENYALKSIEEILNSIVKYDDYDFVEVLLTYIHKEELEPLLLKQIRYEFSLIEKHNLKLEI